MARTGRPPTITKKWADKTAETLPEMFISGESVAEVCAELGICKTSFYKAGELSADFLDAYKKGLDLSEAWWTKLGRFGSTGKTTIQPATWIFNMKNRHGWKDKIETSGSVEVKFSDLSPEERARKIKEYEDKRDQSLVD